MLVLKKILAGTLIYLICYPLYLLALLIGYVAIGILLLSVKISQLTEHDWLGFEEAEVSSGPIEVADAPWNRQTE